MIISLNSTRLLLKKHKHLKVKNFRINMNDIRLFSDQENDDKRFSQKYKVFKDEDSSVIFDVQEERLKKQNKDLKILSTISVNENMRSTLERLENGSYNIESVVELLKVNNGKDILVMKLPLQLNYVEYMVIISCSSRRHLTGLAEVIRKEIKHIRSNNEEIPTIEGANSNWIALDLGNIMIHLMMKSVREVYDLESLWAVGPKYDLKLKKGKEDEVLELLKKHSTTLDDLQPRSVPWY